MRTINLHAAYGHLFLLAVSSYPAKIRFFFEKCKYIVKKLLSVIKLSVTLYYAIIEFYNFISFSLSIITGNVHTKTGSRILIVSYKNVFISVVLR